MDGVGKVFKGYASLRNRYMVCYSCRDISLSLLRSNMTKNRGIHNSNKCASLVMIAVSCMLLLPTCTTMLEPPFISTNLISDMQNTAPPFTLIKPFPQS